MANDAPHHETVLEATGVRARLARVYAESLMGAASEDGQVEAIGTELNDLGKALANDPTIEPFLSSAAIGRKARLPLLAAAFEGRSSPLLRKFIGVLNQNGRLGLIRAINAAYQKLLDDAGGRIRVKVTSAVPLSEAQQSDLKAKLTEQLKAEPIIDLRTNPDLLGGLIVQVRDTVYDTSVRTRLNNLRNHLMASSNV